jgi:hypothetical protein
LGKEESSSFLKKRTKKLLSWGVYGRYTAYAKSQKFFASFFQKRRPSFMLTRARIRAYLSIWLILQCGIAVSMAMSFQRASAAQGGKPVAADFMTFWSAARMAVLHGPASAYDDAARAVLQHSAGALGGDPGGHYAYWYPPTFLLLTLPLGLVGYVPALCAFLAAGYALLIATLRRIAGDPLVTIALIASPAMLLNTIIGQNGSLTASCFAGAMLLLERAPVAAGACLGFLVCKPHLAVLIPLALAAAGRWRAFFACGGMALLLCAASLLWLGPQVWWLFMAHSAEARAALEYFPEDWAKIQSMFSAARLLGASVTLAYGLHALVAVGAAYLLWRVARKRPGAEAEMAVLTVSALLATPYMFDYDLVCLLVPMAWLCRAGIAGGWRSWEKIVLLLVYVLPLVARFSAGRFGVPLIPVPLVALLLVCARRALDKEEMVLF